MSPGKLRVYGWRGWRPECPAAPNGSRQTRDIVAAHSRAEAARIAGEKGPWALDCLEETGNTEEIAQALSEPGVIFWRPNTDWKSPFQRVAGGGPQDQTI
jgi:hypothetical protein